jgi:ABC-2 type transport system permease protein
LGSRFERVRDSARVTIAGREITALSREKTIVLALLIQLFIAAFSSFLVVGLTSLYDPGAVEGEVEIAISGDQQDALIQAAEQRDTVDVTAYENGAEAIRAFENGEVNAVITARSVETEQGNQIEVDATVPAEGFGSTIVVVQVRQLLFELEQSERTDRVEYLDFTPIEMPAESEDDGGFTQYFTFTYTILIPLLLFLPPFISGSVVVDSITEEIERETLELLRVSPVSLSEIVDGKAIGMVLIAPLQALLWIGLLWLNGIAISNVATLLLLVSAVATITVVVGLLLGLVLGSRREAQLLYSMLVLLLFAAAAALPEHPASTVARLAVDSPSLGTFAHVGLYVLLAVGGYLLVRWYLDGLDPESL